MQVQERVQAAPARLGVQSLASRVSTPSSCRPSCRCEPSRPRALCLCRCMRVAKARPLFLVGNEWAHAARGVVHAFG